MSSGAGKFFLWVGAVFLLLIFLCSGFLFYTIRHSFPKTSGEIHIRGLNAPVEIYRDQFGIPQICASTQHDLFLAQGYVHAQDRFWQMDVWRHTGAGRLSEIFGKSQLQTDQFLRTLGWARVVQKELDQSDANSLAILNAYAEGVNAYLSDHSGSGLSLEYAVLRFINSQYKPAPWIPLDSLIWGKVMAWDLGTNMFSEIQRSILLKTLTQAQVEELYPPYPSDQPVIVPGFAQTSEFCGAGETVRKRGEEVFSDVARASPPAGLDDVVKPCGRDVRATSRFRTVSGVPARQMVLNSMQRAGTPAPQKISFQLQIAENRMKLLGHSSEEEIGSNNWVISGERTSTRKPILCNDPHLSTQMPSIWYQVGLHCKEKNADCPYEVTGFSFAGVPGIIIGHNERVAWDSPTSVRM